MAFDLTAVGGYGSGSLGDVENLIGVVINTVGTATNIDGDSIKLDAVYTGTYGTFKSGDEILIVIEGALTFTDDITAPDVKTYLGRYCVCKVTAFTVGTNTLTVDTDVSQKFFGGFPITKDGTTAYPAISGKIIVVTIPHYRNLTLNAGTTLTPRTIPGYGNILALKCSKTLTFAGGHINLRDTGLPTTEADNRPLMTYEDNGTKDTDKYSGWENSDTKDRLILNVGDGAAFIIAKKMVCHADSRIGNIETDGVQFCRGAIDSNKVIDGSVTGVTNIGGSTILICAGTISSFAPEMIAKYRSSSSTTGKGLARCYIASETKLRNDEGLYAYDCISTPTRITSKLNIKSFGDGSDNALSNPTKQINNYATITSFTQATTGTGATLTYSDMTTTGSAIFTIGAMVMFHFNHKSSTNTANSGKFVLGKIIGMDATTITIDANPPSGISNPDDYNKQLITVPQYTDFTLSIPYQATPAYDGSQGGIFAIACSGTCDLSDGAINVEDKGGGKAYAYNGLNQIGNAQDSDKLPIGQGHGSVFILAQNLVMNANTRIGGTQNGANFGGSGVSRTPGGYKGGDYTTDKTHYKYSGWGGGGGSAALAFGSATDWGDGGYGSNAYMNNSSSTNGYGVQGAHIMIIADTITGFNQASISTGGTADRKVYKKDIQQGGAGYGGVGAFPTEYSSTTRIYSKGGYNGGGGTSNVSDIGTKETGMGGSGGSSGWAFIYCNNVVNQDTTNTVVDY